MKLQNIITFCLSVLLLILEFNTSGNAQAQSKNIKVIELRNYLMRPQQRDHFIDAFETKLVDSLNGRGNYVLGQYRVKDAPDNFVWIRGFHDITSRLGALEGFYNSKYWQQHVNIPQKYVTGYTNVYLLKPLHISDKGMDSTSALKTDWFGKPKGLTVVDFYIANERRAQLIDFVATTYDSVLQTAGVKDISYWISERTPNDYPNSPVFQDKNLLVTIAFYKDEAEYQSVINKIEASMSEDQKFERGRLVTTKTTWILYPTKKSFNSLARQVSK